VNARGEKDEFDAEMLRLNARISMVKEREQLRRRLEQLPMAWVLVFDVDTDEETVYSLELAEEEQHVVVAFEDRDEAERYARTLDAYDPFVLQLGVTTTEASVQELDLEALVVSSREAEFRVAVVFQGDLQTSSSAILSSKDVPTLEQLNVSYTLVPDDMFEGKTTADLIDVAEDTVWVLVQDAGTGDAHYFSMDVNGTASVICFKDEDSAMKCCTALHKQGIVVPTARSVYLEDILDAVEEGEPELEVCLVDEVLEMFDGDAPEPPDDRVINRAAARRSNTREMLDRIYSSPDRGGDGSGDDGSDESSRHDADESNDR